MSVLACCYCGRSGGGLADGSAICHACLAREDPTPLQSWAQNLGRRLVELEAETGLTKKTIMRAARGQRMSPAVADALAQATGLPADSFTVKARHQEWKP